LGCDRAIVQRTGEVTATATTGSYFCPARQAGPPDTRRDGPRPISWLRQTAPRETGQEEGGAGLLEEGGDVEIVVVPKVEAGAGQLHLCVDQAQGPARERSGTVVVWLGS
jgi:hypothetical protein